MILDKELIRIREEYRDLKAKARNLEKDIFELTGEKPELTVSDLPKLPEVDPRLSRLNHYWAQSLFSSLPFIEYPDEESLRNNNAYVTLYQKSQKLKP